MSNSKLFTTKDLMTLADVPHYKLHSLNANGCLMSSYGKRARGQKRVYSYDDIIRNMVIISCIKAGMKPKDAYKIGSSIDLDADTATMVCGVVSFKMHIRKAKTKVGKYTMEETK